MSTHPHIVLPWTVRPTPLPSLAVPCHCGLASAGDGKLGVNANGKPLDIRLLVARVSCDRSSNTTVHDRVPVRYLDPILLRCCCSGGSSALVARLLLDPLIFGRDRFALKRDSCWEQLAPSPPGSPGPVQVPVIFEDVVPRRPERLIAHGAGHPPRGARHDRHSAEPQNSQGLLARPGLGRRRGPEPGRAARWPCPRLHHAAVRARSLMTGHERRSGPAGRRRGR